MRDKIGGFLILFGLLIVGMGFWEAFFEDTGEAWKTMLTGGVIVATGHWIVVGGLSLFSRRAPAGAEAAVEGATFEAPISEATAETAPSGPAEKRFTIVQTGDDDVLDRVADLLAGDDRITDVVEEGGRWYSVPDRDDLPEWFALRVYCQVDDLDAFMEEIDRLIEDRLGSKSAAKVRVDHY
ncbi:hypothetical protein [Roseibium aggregatum]|uniref:Uncharacterized protein n=1 Tax=Roseibium aggregatum TaxID=187304 RepID=A0A926S6H3_9HYPH|nr:hypothetical protein [Roseibium aggregatum]MBD1547551.1 hypothetical protein [Roseibium aggregatum]